MAVRNSGDDDRNTVDLGPRALEAAAAARARAPGDDRADSPPHDDDPHDFDDPDDDDASASGTASGAGAGSASDLGANASTSAPQLTARLRPGAFGAGGGGVHGQQTQLLSTGKKVGTDSNHTKYTTTSSPLDALHLAEVQRYRIFVWMVYLASLGGIVSALVTQGDAIARRVVIAGCCLTSAGAVWLTRVVKSPTAYTPSRMSAPMIMIGIGTFMGLYYWGVASPVAALFVYGIYLIAYGTSTRVSAVLYALVGAIHGTLLVLVMTGALVDRGLIRMSGLEARDQVGVLVMLEFLYAVTFYTARVGHKITLDVMRQLEQAVRGVAQREAMLAEARADLDRALKIGGPGRYTDQVVGTFKLGVLIGRGGMGEVYEAQRVDGRGEAAVKLLHPGTLGEPTHVARFVREAQTSSRLDCPHVVRVLEVGTTAGEIPYLAMERLRGFDLAQLLRKQRRLSFPQARELASHIALGLAAAREAGIVHRDLKPHNVFCDEGAAGRWKVLDFGVSKAGGSGTLTQGHVVGTPAYMAPEQARGEQVDHRADVYSLAAILYRAITGHPAFSGKDVPTTLYDVVYRVPTQPSMLASLPSDVDRVLALGLAKSPGDRFETAEELARWFASAIEDSLSLEQRQRADEVLAKHPWGTRQSASGS